MPKKRTPKRFYTVALIKESDAGYTYEEATDDFFDLPIRTTRIKEAIKSRNSLKEKDKTVILKCEVIRRFYGCCK